MNIHGTTGADSINGRYGADTIDGDLGNDTINGGAGNDTITGGGDLDSLNGGSGDDVINAGGDTSVAFDSDTVAGGAGNDTINWGGGYAADVTGGDGLDVLSTVGATSASTFGDNNGDWDIETFIGGDQIDYVAGGLALSAVNFSGGGGADTLLGSGAADTLSGGDGDDLLSSSLSTGDSLSGGAGDDVLIGRADGHQVLNGGDGRDLAEFVFNGSDSRLTVTLSHQGAWQTGGALDLYLSGVEDLRGSYEDDKFTGDGNNNLLDGALGNDSLVGKGGDDILVASGSGSTFADGGAGNDTLSLANFYGASVSLTDAGKTLDLGGETTVQFKSVENLSGSQGDDSLTGDDAANRLYGGVGSDSLVGGAGDDELHGDQVATRLGAVLEPDNVQGQDNDTLVGGAGSDKLFGEIGADTLLGGDANDTLDGGAGRDVLTGGGGLDTYVFSSITDSSGVAEYGAPDLITDFNSHETIDLGGIDADVNTDGDQAFTVVREFTGHAGELVLEYDTAANLTHLMLDVNGDGAQDMIVDLNGYHANFSNFVL
jgi:Ca2+-binding RTX toxin-like protein